MGEMDHLRDENEELKEKLKKLQKANSSLKRIHANIHDSIFVDEAIRLYNSRYLNIRLDEEMRRAKRYNQFLSLVLLSVGFLVGDAMKDSPEGQRADFMKKLGEFIKTNLRDTDIISLYHKDVIALILPETSVEGAVCLSERLKDQILFAFFNGEIDSCKKGNSVSIGITSYPTDARVIDELINNATHMLERSRGSEGNTIYCSIMN